MSKHTPGPWILGHNMVDPTLKVTSVHKGGDEPNWCICTLSRAFPNEETLANAKLIAAAPELLVACRAWMDAIASDMGLRLRLAGNDLAYKALKLTDTAIAAAEPEAQQEATFRNGTEEMPAWLR
jgi:hypothetical protein